VPRPSAATEEVDMPKTTLPRTIAGALLLVAGLTALLLWLAAPGGGGRRALATSADLAASAAPRDTVR
jgi:hypothetical protein